MESQSSEAQITTTKFNKGMNIRWELDQTASEESKIAVFGIDDFEQGVSLGTSRYAPLQKNTLHFNVRFVDIASLFVRKYGSYDGAWDENQIQGDANIPIAFLWALASGKLEEADWTPPTEPYCQEPKEDLYNKGFSFEEAAEQTTLDVEIGEKELWVPIRHSNGELWFGCLKLTGRTHMSDVRRKWIEVFSKCVYTGPKDAGKGGGWCRAQNVVLEHPLLFRLTDLGKTRFQNFDVNIETFMEKRIKTLNSKYRTKTDGPAARMYTNNDEADYQLLGECPFQLYVSYISKEDHHTYMKDLLKGCYMTPEEDALALRNGTRKESRPLPSEKVTGLHKLDKFAARQRYERAGGFYGNAHKEQNAGMAEINRSERKQQVREGRRQGERARRIGPHIMFDKCRTQVTAHVTAARMNTPPRRTYNDQKVVAGGFSAPQTAKNILGWAWCDTKAGRNADLVNGRRLNDLQMINGFYIAEWLHMSAYSFGGLFSKGAGSSQIPQNLVLGTSETNSVMTRYEAAWQKLIRAESKILTNKEKNKNPKRQTSANYGGLLIVTRHPYQKSGVERPDVKQNVEGPDMEQELRPVTETQSVREKMNGSPSDRRRRYAPFFVDTVKNGRFVVQQEQMDERKQRIAANSRWVCYCLDWRIEIEPESKILALPAGAVTGRTRFYPFLRPLFHAMEATMDRLLWKHMVANVEGKKVTDDGTVLEVLEEIARGEAASQSDDDEGVAMEDEFLRNPEDDAGNEQKMEEEDDASFTKATE